MAGAIAGEYEDMTPTTDDRDLSALADQLVSAAPPPPDPDGIRRRGSAIRRRQRAGTSAVALVLALVVAVPIASTLRPSPAPVDLAGPLAPAAGAVPGIRADLLPQASLAVVGDRASFGDMRADFAVVALDGTTQRAVPTFDPGQVIGFDVADTAISDDFTVAWHLGLPDRSSCQVGIGRDSANGSGFAASAMSSERCQTGTALSAEADLLAWTQRNTLYAEADGVDPPMELVWQVVVPAGPDATPSPAIERQDGTFEFGGSIGGGAGSPGLVDGSYSRELQGVPDDLALTDWHRLADGAELLQFRSGGVLWESVVTRTPALDFDGLAPSPVPPTADGFAVLDRAPTARTPGAPAVLLLQDPGDGSIHLQAPDGGPRVQVGPAGSDPAAWYLDALEGTAVVGDGTRLWLLARDGDIWTDAYSLPGEVRAARLIPDPPASAAD
jgi:hypothetical protein